MFSPPSRCSYHLRENMLLFLAVEVLSCLPSTGFKCHYSFKEQKVTNRRVLFIYSIFTEGL